MAIVSKKNISDFLVQTNNIPSDEVIKSLIERASTYAHSKTHVFMVNGDQYNVTKISDNVWRVLCCSLSRDCFFFVGKEVNSVQSS